MTVKTRNQDIPPTKVPNAAGAFMIMAGVMALLSFIINFWRFPQITLFDNYNHSFYGRAMAVNLAFNCGAAICLLYSGLLTIKKRKWDTAYVLGLAGIAALSCANMPTTFNLLVNDVSVFWSTLFINYPGLIIAVIGCVTLASCRRDIHAEKDYSGKKLGFRPAARPDVPPGDLQAIRYLGTESGREAAGTLMIIVAILTIGFIYGSIYNYNEKPNGLLPNVGPDTFGLYFTPLGTLAVTAMVSGFLSTVRKRWRLSFLLALLSGGVDLGYFILVYRVSMVGFGGLPYFINGFIVIQSIICMILTATAVITIGLTREADDTVRISKG
jgi:hypothetical protein